MNKQELIAYLDAVCDAESAVYACSSAVRQLEQQLTTLTEPICPALSLQPLPTEPKAFRPESVSSWGSCIGKGILIGFVSSCAGGALGMISSPSGYLTFIGVASAIASVALKVVDYKLSFDDAKHNSMQAYQYELERIERTNASLQMKYKEQLNIYNQHIRMLSILTRELPDELHQLRVRLDSATAKLQRLYSLGNIYPNFRNAVAVFTLREYLKMGICTELEGANGAYAQYMQDIRAARICASIDDLREAVVESISQLQRTLVDEINNVNQEIHFMCGDISANLNKLGESLNQSQALATGYLTLANQTISRIEAGTATIAINQYISNRMAGVDAYLI